MITQLINKSGNAVKNQFVITEGNTKTFQSYNSIIAKVESDGTIYLDAVYWDYSATTLKHLKTFLDIDLSKKQIQANLDNGTYKLTALN